MSAVSRARSAISNPRHRTGALVFGACAIVLFASVEAFAEPPQREAKAPSRVPYQAYLTDGCITGSNFCRYETETVPAGSVLEIQRVACQGWHINTMPPSFVVMAELRTSEGAFVGRIDFLKTTPTPVSWGTTWSISEQTLMFIPAGHRMEISLNSGSTGVDSYGCTVAGYMIGG